MMVEETAVELAYQWSWAENSGKFVPFDPDQNVQIEMGMLCPY